jgi:hypothetical protein
MRASLLMLCLAAFAVRAQTQAGGSSEVEGTEVKQPPTQQPTPQQGQVEMAPPEGEAQIHTVEKGDTLWDLSGKYLGSPWYWPKVWSYNPQIANPHWIYPGNQVRFYPGNGGQETPTRAEMVNGGDDEDLEAGQPVEDDGEVQVVRLPVETKTREIVLKDGFATPNEIEAAGTLVASYAESELLSPGNVVYLDFKDKSAVQVGASYLVFQTVGKVYHPHTGKFLGYQTQILGTVKVNRTSEPKVRATLEKAFDEIGRGAKIGPARERLFETVAPVPNAVALQNLTVVSQLNTSLTMAGEQVRVLVDAGSTQGVQVGNVFTVIRQVDPILSGVGVDPSANQDKSLPVEEVGRCMAVDVREAVTTCLLIRSYREVVVGDRVELRAGGPQTAGITR